MPMNWRTKMKWTNPRKTQTTGAHPRRYIKLEETYNE